MTSGWRTSRIRRHLPLAAALVTAGVQASGGAGAVAGGGDGSGHGRSFDVRLSGYEETPAALSTTGAGTLRVRIDRDGTIGYRLSYSDLEGTVTQAHIHFGAVGQSGGVSAWLCGNP